MFLREEQLHHQVVACRAPITSNSDWSHVTMGSSLQCVQCSIPVDPERLADFFQQFQLAKQEDVWRKYCGHSNWLRLQ
jgi:hypothetical protein